MLNIVAIAICMTPAAYRRQVEQDLVSERFLRLASLLLVSGTVPLAASICVEAYLVGQGATGNEVVSIILAIAAAVVFVSLWYVLPRVHRRSD